MRRNVIRTQAAAKAHRLLGVWLMVAAVLWIVSVLALFGAQPLAQIIGVTWSSDVVGLSVLACHAVVSLAGAVLIAAHSHLLGGGIVVSAMMFFVGLVPGVNVCIAAGQCGDSKQFFRSVGVRCTLLRVARSDLHHLPAQACGVCGYDVSGLPAAVCPECGKSLSVRR